jgi:hypothetical protein
MSVIEVLGPLLGPPPVRLSHSFEEVEHGWGIRLPDSYKEIGAAYGDALISDFIFICGPKSLQKYETRMGRLLRDNPLIPGAILPDPNGMLLWGNTIEGDQLFLVDNGSSGWTVSAWLRQWMSWYESNLPLADWLYQALSGQLGVEWLPEWESPHTLETDDD